MFTARHLSFAFVIRFAWKPIVIFFLYSFLVTALYQWAGWTFLALPFAPIGVLGTAVAFYVGFKNNSSYERLWEARKIWGSIVNISRTVSVEVLAFLQPSESIGAEGLLEHQRIILYRHIAYINAVRIQLRQRRTWNDKEDPFRLIVEEQTPFVNQNLLAEIKSFLHDDEANDLYSKTDVATHLLKKQADHLQFLHAQGCIDSYKQVSISKTIALLYDQQGGCERIKNYPFPRQYAYFSELFVWVLALVIPYGLLGSMQEFGQGYIWLTIPMSMLISWIFNVMEIVGDRSENPFENGVNDIPMTAICRNIEIDIKQMLNEPSLPPRITPVNNILM